MDEDLREMLNIHEPPLRAGKCLLGEKRVALLVQNSLLFFERKRYHLSAWCVMPNHVHVVVSPLGDWKLSEILHSWKSFTAHEINRVLGASGKIWERESFDHVIRTCEHWGNLIQYTCENPVEARLCRNADTWPFSSCGTGFEMANEVRLVDPRELPFVRPRTRGELPHLIKEGCTYSVTFRLYDAVKLRSE